MNKKHKDTKKPFKWKQFEGEIILWLIRWYGRYALSYNDLKEMACERGLSVERSTICRWVHEFSPMLSQRIRPYLNKTSDSWKLDETVPSNLSPSHVISFWKIRLKQFCLQHLGSLEIWT